MTSQQDRLYKTFCQSLSIFFEYSIQVLCYTLDTVNIGFVNKWQVCKRVFLPLHILSVHIVIIFITAQLL